MEHVCAKHFLNSVFPDGISTGMEKTTTFCIHGKNNGESECISATNFHVTQDGLCVIHMATSGSKCNIQNHNNGDNGEFTGTGLATMTFCILFCTMLEVPGNDKNICLHCNDESLNFCKQRGFELIENSMFPDSMNDLCTAESNNSKKTLNLCHLNKMPKNLVVDDPTSMYTNTILTSACIQNERRR